MGIITGLNLGSELRFKLTSQNVKWIFVFLSAFSIFYVLYVLEAFGIQQGVSYSNHSYFERCLYYTLANGVIYYFFEFIVFTKKYQLTNLARLFKVVIYTLFGSFIVFLLFNYFWCWTEWTFSAYFLLLGEYLSLMLLPFIECFFLEAHLKKTAVNSDYLTFSSINGKSELKILPSDFLFLKSEGNYVKIFYRNNGLIKKELIRNTLKEIRKKHHENSALLQCQRSYLINPSQIQKKVQKKGKCSVEIESFEIPVSTNFKNNVWQA